MRTSMLIFLSCVYWIVALPLSGLAALAPCGLAPGAWCEQEGPSGLGAALAMLGPVGVLLIAAAIYAGVLWLGLRYRKDG